MRSGFTAAQLSERRDEDQLPIEACGTWVKYVDPETGYAYYYDEVGQQSTYERPKGLVTTSDPFASIRNDGGLKMIPAYVLNDRRGKQQLPIEKLNDKWEKFVDPESGQPYYYNASSEFSTYDRPQNFRTAADAFASARREGVMPAADILSSTRSAKQKPSERLNGGWVKYEDPESGHPYYYNETSQESTYDRPENFETNANPFGTASSSASSVPPPTVLNVKRDKDQLPVEKLNNYSKYIDPETSTAYYYNADTDESTYTRPEGFNTAADPFASKRKADIMPPAAILSSTRSAKQKPTERLNGGWVKYEDPESGHPYYYNETSQESTYDRPENFETSANPFGTPSSSSTSKLPPPGVLSVRRDEDQLPVEKLNNGYVKYIDPETSTAYYYNADTDESTYTRPEGFKTAADAFNSARKKADEAIRDGVMPDADVLTSTRSAKQKPTEKLNGGWAKYEDPESGHPYYYNEGTQESTYERPDNFETIRDPFGGAVGDAIGRKVMPSAEALSSRRSATEVGENLNGGWVKYVDPGSGFPYYYHATRDVSQYERPEQFVTSYNPFGTVKSRRRTVKLPKTTEGEPMEDEMMGTAASGGIDALDSAMMATFNGGGGTGNYEGANEDGKETGKSYVPSLRFDKSGKSGKRKSSIGRSGKTVLSSATEVLDKVNMKLEGMSMEEKVKASQGDGLMSTLRRDPTASSSSSSSGSGRAFVGGGLSAPKRDHVVIPHLDFGNVTVAGVGGADSLDELARSSGYDVGRVGVVAANGQGSRGKSWLEVADDNEGSVGAAGRVAGTRENGSLGDSRNVDETEWVEFFDEEVGAKYYYNERTGEASWVDPSNM